VHIWCRLLEKGCKPEVLRDSNEVTDRVKYKCISRPQVARHLILCVSQSTYPQVHTLDVMQILYAQSCASFAKIVSSDKGFTCAVNYLLNRRAIMSYYTQQSTTREDASFSASQ